MSRAVAAGMILLYQRHVSPRKGYACPRRVLRGRLSCAEFARRAVRRVGLIRLVPLMRRRFARCAAARRAAVGQPLAAVNAHAQGPRPLDYQTPQRKERAKHRWRSKEGCGDRSCNSCDAGDLICCVGDLGCGGCDGPGL